MVCEARGFGQPVLPAVASTQCAAVSRSVLWPAETKTGETPSRVRSAAPITSPRWMRGESEPRCGPGTSARPTSRDFASPIAGTSNSSPRWLAIPEPSRVGDTVAVGDEDVGAVNELGQCIYQHRRLAKGKQPRCIGHRRTFAGDADLGDFEAGPGHHDDGAERLPVGERAGDIDAGDVGGPCRARDCRARHAPPGVSCKARASAGVSPHGCVSAGSMTCPG